MSIELSYKHPFFEKKIDVICCRTTRTQSFYADLNESIEKKTNISLDFRAIEKEKGRELRKKNPLKSET